MTLFGLMFILFLGLKLAGCIAWSWWWVTCPLWAPWAIVVVIGGTAVLLKVLSDLCEPKIKHG